MSRIDDEAFRNALDAPFEGFSPEPSDDMPPEEPATGSQSDEEGSVEGESPQPFDERYKEDFVGLLYLGRLTESFTLWGHRFTIKTLSTEDLIHVSQVVSPHKGQIISGALMASATLAAAVVSVDGKSLPVSIEVGDSPIPLRTDYINSKWMPPVRDAIYERYLLLEQRAQEAVEALGKA